MFNAMGFIREKKEAIKAHVHKRDLERDFQREKELKSLEHEEKLLLKRDKLKSTRKRVREMRHPVLHRIAKGISENVKKRQAENRGSKKGIMADSSNAPSLFGESSGFMSEKKNKEARLKKKVTYHYE